jgi:hypothetical protein
LADQPRPRLRASKSRRDRLIALARNRPGWALGCADEVWFSRLAQPALSARTAGGERLRLTVHAADRTDPDPKALACYGLWLPALPAGERRLLRFVDGRPVSAVTRAFLAWATERLAADGVRVLALIWDNASWPISREVRAWIKAHNRRVKASRKGCRLLVGRLPGKSPWLNPIGPKWGHGKRAVVEPARKLATAELEQRLCAHYRCPLLPPLAQKVT